MQTLLSRFDIIRITSIDDVVGGAEETGTTIAANIPGHINVRPPSQLAIEQGLETPRIADIFLRPRPGTLLVQERDHVLIVGPPGHPGLNQQWRIVSVAEPDMHPMDRRRFIKLRATRVDYTRSEAVM